MSFNYAILHGSHGEERNEVMCGGVKSSHIYSTLNSSQQHKVTKQPIVTLIGELLPLQMSTAFLALPLMPSSHYKV